MGSSFNRAYKYTLLIPGILLYFVLGVLPNFIGLGLSFVNTNNFDIKNMTFAGFQNFVNILTQPTINIAIVNSFIFAGVTTFFKVGTGFVLAVFLNQKLKTRNFVRAVFFFPAILNVVAVGIIFSSLMYPLGVINSFLRSAGLGALAQDWLTNPKIAIFSVSAIEIWMWSGFTMVILLAGLQSISSEYYEAADIDGASSGKKFLNVTFPLIMPYFNNALVVNIIGGLGSFGLIYATTQGGPGSATEVFGTFVFKSFGFGRYGEGSAANLLLSIIVLIIVIPTYRYIAGKEVEL